MEEARGPPRVLCPSRLRKLRMFIKALFAIVIFTFGPWTAFAACPQGKVTHQYEQVDASDWRVSERSAQWEFARKLPHNNYDRKAGTAINWVPTQCQNGKYQRPTPVYRDP